MTEIELIEQAAVKVGMTSLLNHGAASCVYSEGCNGVTQAHLVAFAREVALHCVAALGVPGDMRAEFMAWVRDRGCDTDGAWSAWQACWNLRIPAARVEPIPGGVADELLMQPVAWRREWNGDESDLGQWLYTEDESETKDGHAWQPLFLQPPTEAEIRAGLDLFKQVRDDAVSLPSSTPGLDPNRATYRCLRAECPPEGTCYGADCPTCKYLGDL